VLSDNSYVLDEFDRLAQETRNGESRKIAYDVTNQVTKVEGIKDESYSYDQNGNRLAYQTDTANRLISDGVYTYLYDGEGNRIQRKSIDTNEITTYEWDYRNRLVGVTIGTKAIGYLYDATDRRIAKLLNGVVIERYGHDGDDLTVVSDAAGQVVQRYLFGGAIQQS
jgi:uncharacterized protein RhaS with RHS repeats